MIDYRKRLIEQGKHKIELAPNTLPRFIADFILSYAVFCDDIRQIRNVDRVVDNEQSRSLLTQYERVLLEKFEEHFGIDTQEYYGGDSENKPT